jgi:hypothetical protein
MERKRSDSRSKGSAVRFPMQRELLVALLLIASAEFYFMQ